jgi:hypothetical protein
VSLEFDNLTHINVFPKHLAGFKTNNSIIKVKLEIKKLCKFVNLNKKSDFNLLIKLKFLYLLII